jgi:hypothetical protein
VISLGSLIKILYIFFIFPVHGTCSTYFWWQVQILNLSVTHFCISAWHFAFKTKYPLRALFSDTLNIGFEFLMVVPVKGSVSWGAMSCSPLEVHWQFWATYCLYHQDTSIIQARSCLKGLYSHTSQKMAVFSLKICTGQISHLYKTKCKIIVLCDLICMFLSGGQNDKMFRT